MTGKLDVFIPAEGAFPFTVGRLRLIGRGLVRQ